MRRRLTQTQFFEWRRNTERRNFCKSLPGIALGIGGIAGGPRALLAQVSGPDSTQVAQIYQLQAAFHLAKSTRSIDLMMSLWDVNGSLTIPGGSALALCRFRQAEIISVEYGFVHASAILAGPFLQGPDRCSWR